MRAYIAHIRSYCFTICTIFIVFHWQNFKQINWNRRWTNGKWRRRRRWWKHSTQYTVRNDLQNDRFAVDILRVQTEYYTIVCCCFFFSSCIRFISSFYVLSICLSLLLINELSSSLILFPFSLRLLSRDINFRKFFFFLWSTI